MRVVVAPDSFAGTLSAVEACAAIAAGWRAAAGSDELVLAPLSDGGPGFVDVLAATLGGERVELAVADPLGRPVRASWLAVGSTAYVESAQACGLHLLSPAERDPAVTTTYGVGELIASALARGARRTVVGLGGSATNDGGRGFVDALGGLAEAKSRLAGVELVAATDVDNPLLGEAGATAVFGPQKGASPRQLAELEARLERWAAELSAGTGRDVRDAAGAGAAGGLGAALLALGGGRASGIELVAEAVGLPERVAAAGLVITGEGAFDAQSLRGKVVAGVGRLAMQCGVPCVVLAGRVEVGRREAAAAGIETAYDMVGVAGEEAARSRPAEVLTALATRVAKQWSVRP